MEFITKVHDTKDTFVTGAVRGTQEGKPRYDLIGLHAQKREATLLARGAAHYGEHNWEKGQNVGRTAASLFRHLYAYMEGDRTEDHLAAIRFNAASIMHVEEEVLLGRLPMELLDIPWYKELDEYKAVAHQPSVLEDMVLRHMNEEQANSDYVEWFVWSKLKAATLPQTTEQEFANLLAGMARKGWIEGKVVESEVHPRYALQSALTAHDEGILDDIESWDLEELEDIE